MYSDAATGRPSPRRGGEVHEVSRADLPLHCPPPDARLWSAHPRVYLPIEKSGAASCPYCGAQFRLKEHQTGAE